MRCRCRQRGRQSQTVRDHQFASTFAGSSRRTAYRETVSRLFALSLLRGGDLQGPGGGLNGRLPMNTMHPTAAASSFPNYKSSPVSHKFAGSVKQRKVNFSTREVETLLAMVRQYRDAILMSVANGRGWLQAWQSVAKAVSAADGVERSESDCRKKWTYLKWEARHTSKPGRTPTSRAVLDILLNKDSTLENHFAPADPSNTRGNEQLMIPRDWEGLLQSHLRPLLPTPTQASSGSKTIRIGQSLIRPRPIAPAPSQHLQQSQQQQQHHPQQQQQQSPQQQQQLQLPLQQQQQPKTLVLKTIPLKVKHVAPTTIKMAPRQPPTVIPQTTVPQQPTEVCLRWNSYHSNMQNSFPSLLDTEQFVDVTLACEGRSLKCHKMILSTCSDYLADLLRENPCQHPIILMKDIKFWEVEALVRFMYRGEVNVAHDKLPQLLNAAEALQVKGLAGPSPSSQSTKPPMLIPQSKPSTSQPIIQRISAETKEARSQPPNTVNVITAPKRTQKRRPSESNEPSKPFTKIRLQRPQSPVSPTVTVKLEPLDIPLSPTEMFPDGHDDNRSSSPARYGNSDDFHEEEDPEGDRERSSRDRDLNFCEIPGPPDLNDGEEQMEFVPTDFLEQEQDILDDHENEHEHDPDQDGEDGEDGEDEDDGDDGDEIHELNDKDESPGRSRDHDDEIEDDDYSEKLPGDNNMT
ncbi:uncharacterized protein LOC124408604 isoform X2 [Diprion similis]|uniref:uncharacterized protein LOC124408604 isoform X2 n=1 Tax=Diprion similis TaxID=362088 RepID=UPI001EF94887|nr:uncharacterized protein LOC124408604 isoform X2 [Diprion similis]